MVHLAMPLIKAEGAFGAWEAIAGDATTYLGVQ
jgi:hypothetical protein